MPVVQRVRKAYVAASSRRCEWSDEMFGRVVYGVVVILVLGHVGCAQDQIVCHPSLPLAWFLLGPSVVARARGIVSLVLPAGFAP